MYKFFQSTKEEHENPVEGIVQGEIPGWLTGSLYRNGPGLYEIGETKYNHMFDPMAMLQRFHIENKKVTYQNRFLNSEDYKRNIAANRIVVHAVGTIALPDPCKTIFQRFLSYFTKDDNAKSDNSIVNFWPLKDELYVSTENNLIHRVDPETLDVIERVDLTNYVAVHSATAHPHYEADGTIHNVGHSFKGGPNICIIKIPPKEKKNAEFPNGQVMSAMKSCGKMSVNYLHSFGITENYYVYVEQPLFINIFKVLTAKLRGATLTSCMEWWPNIKTRFRILDRKTGEEVNPEIVYEGDPMMVFHHVNAYEHDGHIVMDVCGFSDEKPLEYVQLKDLTSENCEEKWRKIDEPEPRRYIFPLKVDTKASRTTNQVQLTGSVAKAELIGENTVHCTHEIIANTGFEFPQINYPHYNGKKYRYMYGVGWHNKGPHFHTIAKIDANTKTFKEWAADKCYPSEPVFVPNPECKSEDDGVVLAAVNDANFESGKSAFLLILDAKTMTEIARAEFEDVKRFPWDFHGMFRPPSAE